MNEALAIGAVLVVLQAAMLATAWSVYKRLRIVRRIEITEDDPVLPDVSIIMEKPYVYPVGKRALYLQSLTHEMHRRFLQRYAEFLAAVGGHLENLRLLQTIDDEKTRAEVIAQWRDVAFDKNVGKRLESLFRDVFLADRRVNPDGVRWRHLKRLGWEELFFIWQYAAARNVEAVEDFIRALLARLEGRSAKRKPGSSYRSSAESRLNEQYDSRCRPRSSSASGAPNTPPGSMTP